MIGACADFTRKHDGPTEWESQAAMRAAGIPARYVDAKLDDLWPDREAYDVIQRVLARWEETRDDGAALWLAGVFGCGKTWLACAAARACLDSGRSVLFVDWIGFVSRLRSWKDYGRDAAAALEQAKVVDVLILDDFGKGGWSDFAKAKAFELINHRYNARLPAILTTNHEPQDLKTLDNDIAAALYDRLRGGACSLRVGSRSYRGEK
jgi:DNA replication protein DnaC